MDRVGVAPAPSTVSLVLSTLWRSADLPGKKKKEKKGDAGGGVSIFAAHFYQHYTTSALLFFSSPRTPLIKHHTNSIFFIDAQQSVQLNFILCDTDGTAGCIAVTTTTAVVTILPCFIMPFADRPYPYYLLCSLWRKGKFSVVVLVGAAAGVSWVSTD